MERRKTDLPDYNGSINSRTAAFCGQTHGIGDTFALGV